MKLLDEKHVNYSSTNNPSFDHLSNVIGITPIALSPTDKSYLSMLDQDIFFKDNVSIKNEDYSPSEDAEHEESNASRVPSINQHVISEFKYAFNNHTCKSITSYAILEGYLLFDALTIDGTTLTTLFLH